MSRAEGISGTANLDLFCGHTSVAHQDPQTEGFHTAR